MSVAAKQDSKTLNSYRALCQKTLTGSGLHEYNSNQAECRKLTLNAVRSYLSAFSDHLTRGLFAQPEIGLNFGLISVLFIWTVPHPNMLDNNSLLVFLHHESAYLPAIKSSGTPSRHLEQSWHWLAFCHLDNQESMHCMPFCHLELVRNDLGYNWTE
ncbi:hypothetical protein CEXT_736631 [Caerostris extrusa]|uniref:Uncharacterized protein n=1 Tax=Caerostris extrusa TaxID=172846 RepID=A0AAV4V0R7_CAEEX|nr:hypothetical protein CEXT_736631 [Caerostris extrusa]